MTHDRPQVMTVGFLACDHSANDAANQPPPNEVAMSQDGCRAGDDDLVTAERRLLARWPETRLTPSLERIEAISDHLGRPADSFPSIHVTGTNGKTSTSIMIDSLLRASGRTTGRFTSPHLTTVLERIAIDGAPISAARFMSALETVESAAAAIEGHLTTRLSFFEMMVAIGLQAFLNQDVDVAVVEVGMGGTWDATNVIDARVAVVGTVDLDHQAFLGTDRTAIAKEKAGIIKEGSVAVLGIQRPEAEAVISRRLRLVQAQGVWFGRDFDVCDRSYDDAGQRLTLRGLYGTYEDVFLPIHGKHQSDNAATALAATEAFLGRPLTSAEVTEGFMSVRSPGRLELITGQPPVLIDAGHNPHGMSAVADAAAELMNGQLTVVLAVMSDKDCVGMIGKLSAIAAHLICTTNGSPRAADPHTVARAARPHLPPQCVSVQPDLALALRAGRAMGRPILITGSVVTAGEVLALVGRGDHGAPRARD